MLTTNILKCECCAKHLSFYSCYFSDFSDIEDVDEKYYTIMDLSVTALAAFIAIFRKWLPFL